MDGVMFQKAAIRHFGSLLLRWHCRKVRIGAAAALPLGANRGAVGLRMRLGIILSLSLFLCGCNGIRSA